MPAINGDTKVILHRLDQLGNQVGRLEVKQDQYHDTSEKRLVQGELRTALLEQVVKGVCDDVVEIKDKQKKNDFITKWIGGLSAFFGLLWTLALAYLGLGER